MAKTYTKKDQAGVPIAGTTGQVLTKNSNTDFDYDWAAGGGGDLQQVTDVGNTTTNDIIAGAILAGGPTSPGTTNPFLQVYDGSNGVYGGFYFGDDDSFGVSYNTDTTPEGLLTYSGRYASLVFLGTASGAFSGSFSAVNTNPNGQTLDFPTASGTLALSVNGNTADSAGNITLSIPSLTGYLQNNVGITGGTTLIGGTASGEDLTLSSTSNATKGNIFFGTASTYDEANDRFGITQTTPLSKLHINRDGIRVTQSDAYGITLQNSTASVVTSGQDVQYSPGMVFRGTEWLTTTGASHTLDYRMFARPVSGTTAARGGFIIQQSLNGAAYTDMFEVGQTISNSAGYNIRLNNATVFALGGGVVQFYGSSSGMGFYNSTGSVQFAGLDANGRWALTPSSLTTAATINTWNLTQTWNNASGVYTAHRIAITNTNSASTSRIVDYLVGGTSVFSVDTAGGTHLGEGANLIFGTTTGTKIGTATSQKLSLWNATPDVQPTTGITAAAFVTNTSGILNDTATFGGYTIGQIVAALQRIGALA